MDPNQARRELSGDPTFVGLRRPDHRHWRRPLSCFVLDAIKVASASLPYHSRPFLLVLTILAQVRLSKTLYHRGLEGWRTAPNQDRFPRGGGLGGHERAVWEGRALGESGAGNERRDLCLDQRGRLDEP